MPAVVHLVDSSAPPDALVQLSALIGDDEPVVSLGRVDWPGRPAGPVRTVHRPMGRTALASWRPEAFGSAGVWLAWSIPCAKLAMGLARRRGGRAVLAGVDAPSLSGRLDLARAGRHGNLLITAATPGRRQRLIQAGFDSPAVAVLPPVAPTFPADTRADVRARLGLDSGHWLVACPQPLDQVESLQTAIWAFAILRLLRPQARLVLPMGGPAREALQRFALATGFGGDILIAPALDHPLHALVAADAAIFQGPAVPAGCYASAMAAGLPAVAPAGSVAVELSGGQEAVRLVSAGSPRDYAAAMLELLDRPDLCLALGRRARQRAQDSFSRSAVRSRLEGLAGAGPGAAVEPPAREAL